ncbi:hypothetical protein B4N89_27990 [Embleya scabrispora]|uniref:Uncharacterized protein n=1 Tax=Embleya scabrispora TaxID=159449 RepID=A0A1T3P5W6_9ACTN|nr:hypothetical protein [Embleya scabrispora]OPC84260.1 hypothetical protein B4N89_27990 [Embleya scabrispora]
MTTEIASHRTGRTIHPYDLLDDMRKYVGSDREAHDAIHSFLADIIAIDGEGATIISKRPIRPDLAEDNPSDLDTYSWITISDNAEQAIREAFAATYPQDGVEDEVENRN